MRPKVAVVGATGFVGAAVAADLATKCEVVHVKAPRLSTKEREVAGLIAIARSLRCLDEMAEALFGCDVVVNAAGDPDASSLDEDSLFGANALLVALIREAAERAGVLRMVHVSSAVVQNDIAVLDSSEAFAPFSSYSRSKIAGELVLAASTGAVQIARYRPPSVHHESRRVTRLIRRYARMKLALVAGRGDRPSPQALLENVASAVSFLALHDGAVPPVVHHPSEGVTTGGLLEDLSGGRRPLGIPLGLARCLVAMAKSVGKAHRPTAANARRLELILLGQGQAVSWLTSAGWSPPVGRSGWKALADES